MSEINAVTHGIDHVGLTVMDLDATVTFFIDALGWSEAGRKPDYPAVFVKDGNSVVTLWQVKDRENATGFDRHHSVGLHHLAFKIASSDELDALFSRIHDWPGVQVEFAPEFSGKGPKRHFMILEPGGNRIEFAWDPR